MRFSGKVVARIGALGVAAAAIIAPAAAAHATTPPSITLTPSADVANNGTISVTGSDFPTTDTTVYLTECSDMTGVATCDTSNVVTAPLTSGAFTATDITVKTGSFGTSGSCAAAGTCYIAASSSISTHDATNSTFGAFTFAAAPAGPSITLDPNSDVADGGTIAVSGSGFPTTDTTAYIVECGDTSGQASCDTTNVVTAPLTSGAFSATDIMVKTGTLGTTGSCAAGGTCYIAVGSSISTHTADNSTAAPFTFSSTVNPSITVTPNSGLVSPATVTVTGENFAPSSTLAMSQCSALGASSHCDTNVADVTITATDAEGDFTHTFVAKTGTFGDGTCAAGDTCYVAATTHLSPTGGDATNTAFGAMTFKGVTGPAITAKPATNLKDGDSVKVTGSGFKHKAQYAMVECANLSGDQAACDTGTAVLGTTDSSGAFSSKFTVEAGKVGNGKCTAKSACYIVATTDLDPNNPDPAQQGTTKITFAKIGPSTGPAKTKTSASFSKKKDEITGDVTSGGKGVKGLKTELDKKKGGKWKKVDSAKTHKGGAFTYKHVKSGKYKVETHKSKKFKASASKTVKAKA